jgi:hypothetical protein
MRTYCHLIFLVLLFSIVLPVNALENTGRIGGNGGTVIDYLRCDNGHWITGVEMREGTNFFEQVRLRCTAADSTGQWVLPHQWTEWSRYNGNTLSRSEHSGYCDDNTYVKASRGASFNAILSWILPYTTRAEVLTQFRIQCGGLSDNENAVHNLEASRGVGSWSDWQTCSAGSLAMGMRYWAGWKLDAVEMTCAEMVLPEDNIELKEYRVPGPVAVSTAKKHGYEFFVRYAPLLMTPGCVAYGHSFQVLPHRTCVIDGFIPKNRQKTQCIVLRHGWKVKEIIINNFDSWDLRPENTNDPWFSVRKQNNQAQTNAVVTIETVVLEGPDGPFKSFENAFSHCSDPDYH